MAAVVSEEEWPVAGLMKHLEQTAAFGKREKERHHLVTMDTSQEEYFDVINQKVPCRTDQIRHLLSLFGEPTQPTPPSVFIYGHTSTGKSLVLKHVLNTLQAPHVTINCVEHYTARRIFEHVLNHLSGQIPTPENDFEMYAKCDNMNDFVRFLKRITEDQDLHQTIYLMFDKAERLRDMSINLLPAVLRLSELSGLNICSVLITDIVWEKFRCGTGFLEPYILHFSDYSKEELLELMALDCPEDFKPHFYKSYCNLVLSIFHLACRDLSELRHLALLNFPKYIEPIKRGEATVENQGKLWRAIEPQLKKALQTVYLREVSSAQWEKLQQKEMEAAATAATSGTGTPSSTTTTVALPAAASVSLRTKVELPFYSIYLLIAAYLASYNPAKTDKRFFAKSKAGVSKRSQLASMKKHERTSNQLLGPKPFPLDRLMAIFYSIVESRIKPTANIFSQITSLVTLGMLTQIGSSDCLEAPKYKCLVSLEFIKPIARTVDFDIMRYLFDFV